MSNRTILEPRDEHADLDPARADLLRRLEAGERIPASAPGSRIAGEHSSPPGEVCGPECGPCNERCGGEAWIDDEPTVEIEARK